MLVTSVTVSRQASGTRYWDHEPWQPASLTALDLRSHAFSVEAWEG